MNKNEQSVIAQEIRAQYMEKQTNELDELRALDARVKRPANIFGYTFGLIGSLVLGTGMSMAMKVIGSSMLLGVGIGIVGMAMVSLCYPIYKAILKRRKEEYADEILALSEKLMNK